MPSTPRITALITNASAGSLGQPRRSMEDLGDVAPLRGLEGSGKRTIHGTSSRLGTKRSPRANQPLAPAPPDSVADIIRDEKVAALVEREPYRPPARLFVRAQEARDDVLRSTAGASICEGDEHHLIAVELRPVPAAVLADECSAAICRG